MCEAPGRHRTRILIVDDDEDTQALLHVLLTGAGYHNLVAAQSAAMHHTRAAMDQRVTISLGGAAAFPGPETSPSALLTTADQALYRAKAKGRNQVVLDA